MHALKDLYSSLAGVVLFKTCWQATHVHFIMDALTLLILLLKRKLVLNVTASVSIYIVTKVWVA
jgi:hypothetical protein